MEHFKNKAESFFREIRSIEIYKSSDIRYIDNFQGIFPNVSRSILVIDISPETYIPKNQTKTNSKNYFSDIDITFSLLDMSILNVEKCQEYFNKEGFAVVLNTNVEKMLLGNEREPLRIDFLDGKKNDASGTDECYFSITGSTIINPKIQNL